eukprot:COSAG01_NODE_8341_length_2822_cov_9.085200_1_plen_47_part_00
MSVYISGLGNFLGPSSRSLISKPQMCLSGRTTNGYLDPPAGKGPQR